MEYRRKHRVQAVLAALLLAVGLSPATAFAGGGTQLESLVVNGVDLIAEPDGVPGAHYDKEAGELTLNDVSLDEKQNDAYIWADGDLTIVLVGENSINGDDSQGSIGIDAAGMLAIKGDGTLDIGWVDTGLRSQSSVTVDLSGYISVAANLAAVQASSIVTIQPQSGKTILLAGDNETDAQPVDSLDGYRYFRTERYIVTPDEVNDFALLSGMGSYYFNFHVPDGAELVSVMAGDRLLISGYDNDYTYYKYYGYSQFTLTDSACRSFRPADGSAGQTILTFTFEKDQQQCQLTAELNYPKTHVLTIHSDPEQSATWLYSDKGISTADEIFYLPDGEPVTIMAMPHSFYRFVGWEIDGEIYEEQEHTFTLTEDLTVTMKMEKIEPMELSSDTLDFGSLPESKSDTPPAAQLVTLTNVSDEALSLIAPISDAFIIEGIPENGIILQGGKSITLTIQPKAGLPVGVYDAELVIGGYYYVQPMIARMSVLSENTEWDEVWEEESMPDFAAALNVTYQVTEEKKAEVVTDPGDTGMPETGETTNLPLWTGLGIVAAAFAVFAARCRKRSNG